MSRARTGTLEGDKVPLRDASGRRYWRGKVRLKDGSCARVDIPEPKCFSRTASRDHVLFCQEDEDATHAIYNARHAARTATAATTAGSAGESVSSWFGRYYDWREGRPSGAESISDSRGRFKNWIAEKIGHHAMRSVTRDILEDFVAYLDDVVGDERIAPKTAGNIWGEVTAGFAVATRCKDKSLRILDRNPAEDVEGPDDGATKSKPFLRPDEVLRLLACEAIPLARRYVYAVAIYTALRQGELRALRVRDIDLEAMQITVEKTAKGKVEKSRTKGGRARVVSIEPNLVPLLRVLVASKAPDDRLLHVGGHNRCASDLRDDLLLAGCKRDALHVGKNDPMRARMKFHNLKDTCGTHMAVRRDPPQDIQWRLAHTDSKTTEIYIAQARYEAGPSFGVPLAPLPAQLIGPSPQSTQGADTSRRAVERSEPAEVATVADVIARANTQPDVFDSRRLHEDHSRNAQHGPVCGPESEALERELARARAERRWADADAIAQDLERLSARAKVVPIDAKRRRG